MLSFLGGLFGGIWSAIAGALASWAQRQDEQALGQKERAVVDQDAVLKEVQVAADAGAGATRAVDDPGKLRQFESTDPNNRDGA